MVLARAALAEGRRRRAKRYLREALDKRAASPLEIALLLARAGSPGEAEALAGDQLGQETGDIRGEMLRVRLYSGLGREAEARALCRTLVDRFPGDARPARMLAAQLQESGEAEAALEVAHAGLARLPDDPVLRLLRAQLLADLGQARDARADLEPLVETPPEDGRSALQLARLCVRLKAGAAERRFFERLADTPEPDPGLVAQLLRRGFETSSDAVGVARRADAVAGLLGPGQVADLRRDLALNMADYGKALAQARVHGVRSPVDAAELARALYGQNRAALALRYLRFCARRWPQALPVLRARFAGHRLLGDLDGAERVLDRTDPAGDPGLEQAVRTLRLQLQIFRGAVPVAEVLDELAAHPLEDERTLRMLMQYLIARADLPAARRLDRLALEAGALGPRQRWQPRRIAQQWTELQLTRAHFGDERLAELSVADAETLVPILRENAWSFILAQLLVSRTAEPAPAAPAILAAPSVPPEPEADPDRPIPAVIHQYWSEEAVPEQVRHFCDSWKAVPGHEHRLYSRAEALSLLRSDFGPAWVQAFRMVKRPPEASDFLRLCLMARYGGIWADVGDVLTGRLDRLVTGDEGLVVFHETLSGAVANNFIAARPRHPAMVYAARLARQDLLRRSGETVWLKTGPGLLTRALGQYIAAEKSADHDHGRLVLRNDAVLQREVSVHHRLPPDRAEARWRDPRGEIPDLMPVLDRLVATHGKPAA